MRGLKLRTHQMRNEVGAFLVIIAIAVSVLFGFLALTIDVGGTMALRRALVKAADAAALAGAQACAFGQSPQSVATSYAQANLNDTNGLVASFDPSSGCGSTNTFTVTLTKSAKQDFSPLVGGASSKSVIARGTAKWGGALAGPPQPFGLSFDAWNDCFGDPSDPPEIGDQCQFVADNGTPSGGGGPGGGGPGGGGPGGGGPGGGGPGGGGPGGGGTSSNHWGGLDLSTWGQYGKLDTCPPSPGASTSDDWVPGGYTKGGGIPEPLTVGEATYVCADGGLASSVWMVLNETPPLGTIQIFAVLDNQGLVAPKKDKYQVLGLAALKIVGAAVGGNGSQVTITLQWEGFQLSPGLPGGTNFGLGSVALVPNP